MIRILASPYLIIWYIAGWRIEQGVPDLDKYIVLAVPHTSSWDFVFMLAAPLMKGRIPCITMKRELFWWPLSWFLHLMNAVPIDRTQSSNMVQELSAKIASANSIIIAFAPEGTRKKTDHWKTGFYYSALAAKVPIVCGYVDYKRKRVGTGLILHPSGDIAADFAQIRTFYENNGWGKYPDQLSDIVPKSSH